jgi:hypothetical protein
MRIRFSRAGECVVHRRVLPGQPDELPGVVCLAHHVEPGMAAVRPDQRGEDAHCCRLADAVARPVPPDQGKPATVPPGRRVATGRLAGAENSRDGQPGRGIARVRHRGLPGLHWMHKRDASGAAPPGGPATGVRTAASSRTDPHACGRGSRPGIVDRLIWRQSLPVLVAFGAGAERQFCRAGQSAPGDRCSGAASQPG